LPEDDEERPRFGAKAAILAACAFSAYVGYFAGGSVLRAKLPLAGWFAPAFPLICLLLPEGPDMRPHWTAEQRRKLQRAYTVLLVSFAWTMALACVALATVAPRMQAVLMIAISCSLGALLWAGRAWNSLKKELLKPAPVEKPKRAGVDFFEDSCPHCEAALAIFPEDGNALRCACGALLKIKRTGKSGSVSVAELP
jgi:hypothetical protein